MASPVLSPPPLTSPLTQKDGTPSPTWGRWLQLLQSILGGMTAQTVWQTPALNAGWTNSSGFVAQYRKDVNGVVWIQGLVTSSATGTVFTLPAGFRPAQQKNFATVISTAGTEGYGRLRVNSAGHVDIAFGTPTTWGGLDCSFLADG